MIKEQVPKDIRTFEPKFIGPFTKRQTKAIIPAGIIAALFVGVGKKFLPTDFVVALITVIDIPLLLCGFIDIQGMPLWVFVKEAVITKMIYPAVRPYKTGNSYRNKAKQNTITYAYFDGDVETYSGRKLKLKQKEYRKRLQKYYTVNPDMKPLESQTGKRGRK